MGSSKKKEKKRRHDDDYSDSDSGENYPTQSRVDGYQRKSFSSQTSSEKKVSDAKASKGYARTEEYIYDYTGQEIVRGAKDISLSPETDSPQARDSIIVKKSAEKSRASRDEQYASRDEAFPSRKREITPPPPPPGMDWPFEAPKAQLRSRSPRLEDARRSRSNDVKDWREVDERNRDRDYQDNVQRKLKSILKEEKGSFSINSSLIK